MLGHLLGQIFPLAAMSVADDGSALSVPVKILVSAAPVMPIAPMMVVREAPPQATPGARMPQYQLHHPDRIESDDATSPSLRFLLALPGRPVLVEATITIDGKPFRQQREQRVQEILRYIADPEAFKAEAAEAAEAEAAAIAAASATETGILDSIIDLVSEFTSSIGSEPPSALETGTTPVGGDDTPIESTREATDALKESSTPDEPVGESPSSEDLKTPEPEVPAVPAYTAPATIFERVDRYTA